MYCTNCGGKLLDDSVFCTECGTRVKKENDKNSVSIDNNTPLEISEESIEQSIETEQLVAHDDCVRTKENIEFSAEDEILLENKELDLEFGEQIESEQEKTTAISTEETNIDQKKYTEEKTKIYNKKIHSSIKKPSFNKFKTLPKLKRVNKKWILIASIALVVAVIIMTFLLGFNSNSIDTTTYYAMSARMTDDRTAYIPLPDGEHVVINEEVKTATITGDRKRIVVLLEDGSIYVTDTKLSEKNNIADNAIDIGRINNDGFLYKDKDEYVYRVLFADYSTVKLGEDVAAIVAENKMSVLFATNDGEIYTMAYDSEEKTKVGSHSGTVALEAISDDGCISVWVTEKEKKQSIVINEGEDRSTLEEISSSYNNTEVLFSKDQKLMIIANSDSDNLWLKKENEEPVKVKLGANLNSVYYLFSDMGEVNYQNLEDIDFLYVSTKSDSGANLYQIDMSGERERVVSKIDSFQIAQNNLVYLNTDGDLYFAELDGSKLASESRIASDVDMFQISNNGLYVYFMKDCTEETSSGVLYCYKIGTDAPQKIDDGANGMVLEFADIYLMYIDISIDGKTVYYYTDMEEIEDSSTEQGILMTWTYGNTSAEKIASEAINYSVTSGLECGEINPNSFVFLKYSSIDDDENVFLNWMYYNGKEATRLATDVLYK